MVDDPEKAFTAARAHCPDAVTIEFNKTVLKDFAKASGKPLYGTHLETTEKVEKFFPWIDTVPKLAGMTVKQIEDKPMSAEEFYGPKKPREIGANTDETPFD